MQVLSKAKPVVSKKINNWFAHVQEGGRKETEVEDTKSRNQEIGRQEKEGGVESNVCLPKLNENYEKNKISPLNSRIRVVKKELDASTISNIQRTDKSSQPITPLPRRIQDHFSGASVILP